MKFRSLSFKLTLWYILFLAVLVGLSGIFLYEKFKDSLLDDLDNRLYRVTQDLYGKWSQAYGISWQDAMEHVQKNHQRDHLYMQVVRYPGMQNDWEVASSRNIPGELILLKNRQKYLEFREKYNRRVFWNMRVDRLTPDPLRVILAPVQGRNYRLIQIGISLQPVTKSLRQLLIIMILAGSILLLFASLGGIIIIRKALIPVKKITQAARQITTDDLSLRIQANKRHDEIGSLVDTFNSMILRLEDSVKKIKQFSGDVSHELRTPLTIIRGEIEVLLRKERSREEYKEILNSILEETYHMERIIDDLLFLSKIKTVGSRAVKEKINLNDILQKLLDNRKTQIREKSLQVKIVRKKGIEVYGNKNLIKRMIINVFDNAIRYTAASGKILLTTERDSNYDRLTIEDSGIGIPRDSLAFIFDPFYVVDKSRSKETGGLGLGLSIVKMIAESYGITIDVTSMAGKGTTFRFGFPETMRITE